MHRSIPCAAPYRRPRPGARRRWRRGRPVGPARGAAPAAEPKVIEVTTDTPLPTSPPRHPGVPVDPVAHQVSSPTAPASPDPRGATRRPTATRPPVGTPSPRTTEASGGTPCAPTPPVGPSRSSLEVGRAAPPAAARGFRAKVVSRPDRRSRPPTPGHRRARARHRQRAPARPGHPGVLRQPGQRRHHRGPVVRRTSSAPAAAWPATTRPTASGSSRSCPRPRAAGWPTTASSAGSSCRTTTRTSEQLRRPSRPSSASTPSPRPTRSSTTSPSTRTTTAC